MSGFYKNEYHQLLLEHTLSRETQQMFELHIFEQLAGWLLGLDSAAIEVH